MVGGLVGGVVGVPLPGVLAVVGVEVPGRAADADWLARGAVVLVAAAARRASAARAAAARAAACSRARRSAATRASIWRRASDAAASSAWTRSLSSSSVAISPFDSSSAAARRSCSFVELVLHLHQRVDRREVRSVGPIQEARRTAEVEHRIALEQDLDRRLGRVDVGAHRDRLHESLEHLLLRLGFLEALARLLYVGFELRARREGFLVAGGGGVRRGLRGVQAPRASARSSALSPRAGPATRTDPRTITSIIRPREPRE